MSAPSPFTSTSLRAIVAIAVALVAAGCAVPGASRLERAPKGMPPALHHLTADVLGFALYDTDPGSRRWRSVGLDAGGALDALYGEVGIDAEDAAPWIGGHAGVAVRQLPSPSEDVADARIWFADVRDREALDAALPKLRGDGRAVKAYDDGVLVAPSKEALDGFLDAADSYAVPQRKAMREYAAEAAAKSPAAVVFRFDLVRTQVRRPLQDDPALLELARWATESDDLLATRDGWIGVTAPAGGSRRAVRLTGNVEWVPDLSPEVEWGRASAAQLDAPSIDADAVVAVDGIGQHLAAIVTGITRRNGQYVTGQDVPEEEDPFELQPVLDQLDGPSAVAWSRDAIQLVAGRAGGARDDVVGALELAGVRGTVAATDDGALDVTVPLRSSVSRESEGAGAGTARGRAAAAARAGEPPRAPVAWLWAKALGACYGPVAGWVTFDGTGEMTLSADAELAAGECATPFPTDLVGF